MIDAVVLVLREVMEAMLVCCVLLASSHALGARHFWLLAVTACALAGALLYAVNLAEVTTLFDGRGQELVNVLLLVVSSVSLFYYMSRIPVMLLTTSIAVPAAVYIAIILAAAGALIRELAEIFVYVFSYGIAAGRTVPVLSGAAIGAGVGVSTGVFLYYGLLWLGKKRCLQVSVVVMGLISAGLLSQATRFLVQAGLVPGEHVVWDSSWLVAESTLIGELLHALIGYDATPSMEQMSVYLMSLFFVFILLRRVISTQSTYNNAFQQKA
ncbi:MAG: FTR1 family protein [Pseudohongiella sp.]|nr:FTR1 family protein [Pseudohongiella sp.]